MTQRNELYCEKEVIRHGKSEGNTTGLYDDRGTRACLKIAAN